MILNKQNHANIAMPITQFQQQQESTPVLFVGARNLACARFS